MVKAEITIRIDLDAVLVEEMGDGNSLASYLADDFESYAPTHGSVMGVRTLVSDNNRVYEAGLGELRPSPEPVTAASKPKKRAARKRKGSGDGG